MCNVNKGTIVFVLPFVDMFSNYVRAQCLDDYHTPEWEFLFVQGKYPWLFNFYGLRILYRFFYFLYTIIKMDRNDNMIFYFTSPQNPLLLWSLKNIFNVNIFIDIHDAVHTTELLGYKKSTQIINNANFVIYESYENAEFWKNKTTTPYSVVEDTPQHECVYINFKERDNIVIWVGSKQTVKYLSDFIDYFKLFSDKGYKVRLLGCTTEFSNLLDSAGVTHTYLTNYNYSVMDDELSNAKISFIPMKNIELFKYRGNLKAKNSMAHGCLTIASGLEMHNRLITNNSTGYLFNNKGEFQDILLKIEDNAKNKDIAFSGNKYISENFTREKHAQRLQGLASDYLKHLS